MDTNIYGGSLSLNECEALREKGLLTQARRWGYLPPMAGGSPTSYGDALQNPLGPPTMSGTSLTIDTLLNNPTRVTRMVADLVMRNFFLDRIFNTGGEVSGGAVLYDQASFIDVYTDRDVERVQPGSEFPIVTGARVPPLVAQVEKFGGKFPVTDEAKRRNETSRITNHMRRLSNTVMRKMTQRGMAELENAVTAYTRTVAAGSTWKANAEAEAAKVKKVETPMIGVMKAIEALEVLEMGYNYDTIVLNPAEAVYGRVFYTDDAGLKAALGDLGVNNVIVSPRMKAKSAYLLGGKQVGEMRLEEPMRTITEREGAPDLREQTWIQTAINPIFYVTDPYAIVEITGIG